MFDFLFVVWSPCTTTTATETATPSSLDSEVTSDDQVNESLPTPPPPTIDTNGSSSATANFIVDNLIIHNENNVHRVHLSNETNVLSSSLINTGHCSSSSKSNYVVPDNNICSTSSNHIPHILTQSQSRHQLITETITPKVKQETKTFPPPFSSRDYIQFIPLTTATNITCHTSTSKPQNSNESIHIERAFNNIQARFTSLNIHESSNDRSLTLPKNMSIMSSAAYHQHAMNQSHHLHQLENSFASGTYQHHVADVYEPRQHPVHKYWTLPRSIATGGPLAPLYSTDEQEIAEQQEQNCKKPYVKHCETARQNTSSNMAKTDANTLINNHVDSTQQQQQYLYETDEATFYALSPPPLLPPQEPLISSESEKIITTNVTKTYATPNVIKSTDGVSLIYWSLLSYVPDVPGNTPKQFLNIIIIIIIHMIYGRFFALFCIRSESSNCDSGLVHFFV